ncbi:hypothetical protein AAG570_003507, partial [Ranatra chinensis]
PVLSHIPPPNPRRINALIGEYNKIQQNQTLPIHEDVDDANQSRLISRKPPTSTVIAAMDEVFSLIGSWQQEWSAKQNISIPCIIYEPPGFHLPRKSWSALNRVRTEHGRCACAMHKWGKAPTPFCGDCEAHCGRVPQNSIFR